MADRQRGGRLRGRVRGSDEGPEQRFSSMDWSQMDPYEEGQMRDIRNEERDIFGEMASELLEGEYTAP